MSTGQKGGCSSTMEDKTSLPVTNWGPPISATQLQAMQKTDSVLFMVELHTVETPPPATATSLPPAIQSIIDQFQTIFQPLPHLPPQRKGDHSIPLLPRAQPFRLRPYRYNPS